MEKIRPINRQWLSHLAQLLASCLYAVFWLEWSNLALAQSACPSQGGGKGELKCATVYDIQGTVNLNQKRLLSKTKTVTQPAQLLETDKNPNSRARLQFNEGSLARVAPNSRFRFSPGLRLVELEQGTTLVVTAVGSQPIGARTAEARVRTKGTVYLVERDAEKAQTMVSVLTDNPQGPVIVSQEAENGQEKTISLRSGQSVPITDTGFGQVIEFDLESKYRDLEILRGMGIGSVHLQELNQEPIEVQSTLRVARQETLSAEMLQPISLLSL